MPKMTGPHKILTIFISLFCLLWFITITFASPSLQTSPSAVSSLTSSADNNNHLQSFRIKKATPVFLNRRQNKNLKKAVMHRSNSKTTKKKKKKSDVGDDQRRFSAMLPKGYVAPSRSSPCHNMYPNSVTFFCQLSAEMREP